MREKVVLLNLIILIIFFANATVNAKENLIITPYPNSKVLYHTKKNFDELYILKAPRGLNEYTLNECKKVEIDGAVEKIVYGLPGNISAFEAFKNYEFALKKANFNILAQLRTKNIRYFIEKDCGFPDINGFGSEQNKDHFYISAQSPDKSEYIMVYVGEGYRGRPGKAAIGIVKLKQIETGLVKIINAKTMKKEIETKGHVPIYGIYFDFNKATIKPSSEPTIKEIARLLKENPSLKLYVVGHTDSIGDLNYNMKLSKKRAKAVVDELVKKYNINPNRLKAFGVGPLAPVASNKTEEGRSKNRRVELIEP
ncbi:OmpA family protein [Hippea maritima]|uniref:OmpA/MotB domain protein n=1 Tax=Hippea maritima (strain ATCC 700847 / DSM 10411 / MH2) TaxID=760142 RepID=F2LVC4_HIPMA|nr:OmpA family protein [Hippea maritima]AEA33708.1 OmpA/MotB domain protein [Hippea maritima DSM 10411]